MGKKYFVLIFSMAFISITTNAQSLNKALIGSWKTKQTDTRLHSETNEIWAFQNAVSGVWQRELFVSGNAIVCLLKNPFKWAIAANNQVKMTMGKTECNCRASEKRFEEGLDEFVKNLKAFYEGEYFEYKVKIENSSTIYFNDLKLEKKN
jgi:hypothetical protein